MWVPACSTGEEAYSIAISLVEYLEAHSLDLRVQIFGTDVDDDSVQSARRGVYPQSIALDVSPERLQSLLRARSTTSYPISRRIRDLVVFSTHDLARDPPFSRIDLVSCRNLLIYLQPVMQKKMLRIFHYALNPLGFLLLGRSESAGDTPELFSIVDAKSKLYLAEDHGAGVAGGSRCRRDGGAADAHDSARRAHAADREPGANGGAQGARSVRAARRRHQRELRRRSSFADARRRTSSRRRAAATLNILRLARPEIHVDLRTRRARGAEGGSSRQGRRRR